MNLSARGFLLAALVALLGIAGQWWEPGQGLWRLPAGLLVLALGVEWIRHRAAPPRLTLQAPARAALGRPLRPTLCLDNRSPRHLQVEAEQALPEGLGSADGPGADLRLRLDCPAGEQCRRSFTLLAEQLGRITWPPIYSRTRGAFGLAWWPRRIAGKSQLEVVPSHLHPGEHPGTDRAPGDLSGRTAGRGRELLGLRPYQPGDAPRSIDWKATARSGRHMVRLYAQEQRLTLMILIDAGRAGALRSGPLTHLGHCINSAGRLAELAIGNGDAVGLVVYAERPLIGIAPASGIRAARRLRRQLAQTRCSRRESNPVPAVLQALHLTRQRSLMVLFGDLESGYGSGQLARALALLRPKHLPLAIGLRDHDLNDLTRASGDRRSAPYTALAAYEMEHAQRAAELAIRRLGGHAARAFPEDLDRAVLTAYRELRAKRRI